MNKKNFLYVSLDIFIWIIMVLLGIQQYLKNIVPVSWERNISIIAILLLVIQVFQLISIKYKILDFPVIFTILQFIFLYGRIVLKWLNLDSINGWNLFTKYSEIIIYQSLIFSLLFSQGLFCGLILFNNTRIQKESTYNRKSRFYSIEFTPIVGKLIIIFTLPFLMYSNIATIIAQRSSEYVAVPQISGYIVAMGQVFFTGILVLICSKKFSKNKSIVLITLYLIYGILYMVLSGDRRQIVITLLVLMSSFRYIYPARRVNPVKIILLIFLSYLLLNLLTAISSVRMYGINIENVWDQFKYQIFNENLIIKNISEFGNTFFTIPSAMSYYPNVQPFIHGKTYLFSILIAIPGISQYMFPVTFNSTMIFGILEEYSGNPLGGSLPQDLYCNFGFWGFLGSFVLGILLMKVVNKYKNSCEIDIIFYYVSFYNLLNLVRTGFLETIRTYIYSIVIIYIMYAFINMYKKKYIKIK